VLAIAGATKMETELAKYDSQKKGNQINVSRLVIKITVFSSERAVAEAPRFFQRDLNTLWHYP
jgi:hypothetical protein